MPSRGNRLLHIGDMGTAATYRASNKCQHATFDMRSSFVRKIFACAKMYRCNRVKDGNDD